MERSDLAKHLFDTANALNELRAAEIRGQANAEAYLASLEKPSRTELLVQVAKLERDNYALREVIHQLCLEDEDICPECGSEQVHTWRSTHAESNLGDGSGKVCGECDHQWGES